MTTPNHPLDLTIIIPSYNTRQLLHDCLSSLYEQTHGIGFEVICIDDHSPDGSADMVAETFPQVILIRNQTNQFYVKNNNLGMRMSRARYACLLNSDTLLIANAFKALVEYMDQNPGVAACGPKLLNPDRSVQHCIRRFCGPATMLLQALNWHKLFPRSRLNDRYYATGFDYSRAQAVDSIGTTAYVIRRSTWENAGLLDERFQLFVSDLAYNFMLQQKGYVVHYTPCAEVVHLGSQSVNQNAQSSLRELHQALITFNHAYDYFGKSRASKLAVRCAVRARDYFKRAEHYLSPDKRVIKGPGAPPRRGLLPNFLRNSPSPSRKMATSTHNSSEHRMPGWKRSLDLVLGGMLLVLLSPIGLLCWAAVRLTSSGPILHWSRRVGKDNQVFLMPKFRTMQANTPQVATHLLQRPERYLTPVGGLLRKASLDELPQLVSVWRGDLSLVGPRPALFNQDDLVALRTDRGVHRLVPGITGWAQVNGRDQLEIPVKVAYDAEYMKAQSLWLDLRILAVTFWRVLRLEDIQH